jgi:hypothetical protein
MIFRATDKNRFDFYFAEDLVDALTAAQKDAQRVELDDFTVKQVLAYLARRFKLEVDDAGRASTGDATF